MVGLKRTMVLAAAWVGLTVFLMFLAGRCLLGRTCPAVQTVVPAEETLILDAGHGGEDGGAVSVTGARESDINLAVVLRLRDLLAFYGTDPVLLREEDVSLHSPGAVSPREKKTSDLKNRVQAVNHIPNATLLSIHQNAYPQGKYWGSQAFYAKTEGSQELAQALQHVKALAIMDKAESFSANGGPLFSEVRGALYDLEPRPRTVGYVYGLGGRDITPAHFHTVFARLQAIAAGGELGPVYTHLGQRG